MNTPLINTVPSEALKMEGFQLQIHGITTLHAILLKCLPTYWSTGTYERQWIYRFFSVWGL
jgi:hypothetical protein